MNSQQVIDIFAIEPAEFYHSQRDKYLSSHQLMDFMKCPLLYQKNQSGLIQNTETTAYLVGRAAHVRILEGIDTYNNQFAMGGPINPTTGKPYGSLTKKFAEWKELQNKPVLTLEQMDLIEQMAAGFANHREAVKLVSKGMAEGVVRRNYCGVRCQIRLDWFNPNQGIVDLKTCDDLTWFEADARRYRYHNQMAFYQSVLKEAIGAYSAVNLIAIEKKQPFRCGVWLVSNDCLLSARRENEAAIERLKACHTNGLWPTGYEEVRLLDIL